MIGQTVVIRDLLGLLYKPGDSAHEGFYQPDAPAPTNVQLEKFDSLWQHSKTPSELRSLNL